MEWADRLGWLSSCILVVTLGHQVLKQWREGRSEGVSLWLFVGQIAASVGFLAYSVLIENWVFIITNGLLVVNAACGCVITWMHRQRHARRLASTTS